MITRESESKSNNKIHYSEFLSEKSSKVIHTILCEEEADLLKYPDLDQINSSIKQNIVFGDMHANALKFVNFLIRQSVLTMSKEDYTEIIKIYTIPVNELTKADLKRFNEILESTPINNKQLLITLLGDELADKGNNDYFTLKLLEKIAPHLQFDIVLSNHGLEFINMYENGLTEYKPNLRKDQIYSMINLLTLIKKGLVDYSEIEKIIKIHYQAHLKLLSYSMSKNNKFITIYSHAAIGIETIKSLAKLFKVNYNDKTSCDLAKTIENINKAFIETVIAKKLAELSNINNSSQSKINLDNAPVNFPILRAVYTRGYHEENDPPLKSLNGYNLCYVHGHDGKGKVKLRYKEMEINLDNSLGKDDELYKGKYCVLFSNNHLMKEKMDTEGLTISHKL